MATTRQMIALAMLAFALSGCAGREAAAPPPPPSPKPPPLTAECAALKQALLTATAAYQEANGVDSGATAITKLDSTSAWLQAQTNYDEGRCPPL